MLFKVPCSEASTCVFIWMSRWSTSRHLLLVLRQGLLDSQVSTLMSSLRQLMPGSRNCLKSTSGSSTPTSSRASTWSRSKVPIFLATVSDPQPQDYYCQQSLLQSKRPTLLVNSIPELSFKMIIKFPFTPPTSQLIWKERPCRHTAEPSTRWC